MASTDQHPSPAVPGPRGALALRREGYLSDTVVGRGETLSLADDRIDLKTLWRAGVKHRWTIVGFTALCTVAAVLYTLRIAPLYQSAALLQIDRVAQKVVGFNAEVELDEGPASDQLQLRTQIELLKSRSLAERVIDELGLYKPDAPPAAPEPARSVDAAGPTGSQPIDKALAWAVQGWGQLRATIAPEPVVSSPISRAAAVAQFKQAVTVEPIRNSRLVEVRVLNADPDLAARIANTMAKAFIATNIERKLHSSIYAREFLEEQIRQTKAKLEESERVINKYAKKNEILNLGDKGSAATQTFVDFSAALAKVVDPFIQILANKGILPLEKSLKVISEKARMGYLPLDRYDIDLEVPRGFPAEVCRRWCVLPFDRMSKSVLVATANPFNRQAASDLEAVTKQRLLWYLAPPPEIAKALRKVFR